MESYYDGRDYATLRGSGSDGLSGLRSDRVLDALRWPLIWLAIGGLFVGAAWSVGYVYDRIKGASVSVSHGDTRTSVTVNALSATAMSVAEPITTTHDPISGD